MSKKLLSPIAQVKDVADQDDAFESTESRYDTRVATERKVIDRPPKRGKPTSGNEGMPMPINKSTSLTICLAMLAASLSTTGCDQGPRTELQSHPGCFVAGFEHADSVSWTGSCLGNSAEGEGVLTEVGPDGVKVYEEGELSEGMLHGEWLVRYADGTVAEGPFAASQRTGHWVIRQPDGIVLEGLFANGQREGRWVQQDPDDTTTEIPYVDGQKHGTEVRREPNSTYLDGDVQETPWVNGQKHGTQVLRYGFGGVREIPWVNDQKHGTEVYRQGEYQETTPWVDGQVNGTAVQRNLNGDVWDIPYVDGQKHGIEVVRYANGNVRERPYALGANTRH